MEAKMKKHVAGLFCGVLLATSLAPHAYAEGTIIFHTQGDLDADYNALKKHGWLALVGSARGLELKPVRFKIEASKEQTGENFPTVASPYGNVLLIDSVKEGTGLVGFFLVDGLKQGKVEELHTDSNDNNFYKEPRKQFRFKSHSYTFYEKKGLVFARIDGKPFSTAESNALGKISGSNPEGDMSFSFSIDWVGDMNNDGILDLVITASDEKAAETCLLLSKKIGNRIILENAGCQFFSG